MCCAGRGLSLLHTAQCCAMLCNAVQCCAELMCNHAVLCNAMQCLCDAVQSYSFQCCAMLCSNVQCSASLLCKAAVGIFAGRGGSACARLLQNVEAFAYYQVSRFAAWDHEVNKFGSAQRKIF